MEQKMRICPGCGAGVHDGGTTFCPYCGRELIDLSRANTDKKIRAVKRAQFEMTAVQKKLGVAAVVTLLVLFLVFVLIIALDIPGRIREAGRKREMNKLSREMQCAYEKEDWDELEQYLIDECEVYLNSPDYFRYRTAWFLHTYPPLFDEARQARDTEEMLFIYEIMAKDYDMRSEDFFFSVYTADEMTEAALAEEVERETEIMVEEGLEDEMYKLWR